MGRGTVPQVQIPSTSPGHPLRLDLETPKNNKLHHSIMYFSKLESTATDLIHANPLMPKCRNPQQSTTVESESPRCSGVHTYIFLVCVPTSSRCLCQLSPKLFLIGPLYKTIGATKMAPNRYLVFFLKLAPATLSHSMHGLHGLARLQIKNPTRAGALLDDSYQAPKDTNQNIIPSLNYNHNEISNLTFSRDEN